MQLVKCWHKGEAKTCFILGICETGIKNVTERTQCSLHKKVLITEAEHGKILPNLRNSARFSCFALGVA